jgi:molecular chaperone HtpG
MTTTAFPHTEILEFRAETRQLLALVVHSLYTHKEIFLRELISNASDALDRLAYESLTMPELLDDPRPLAIRIETDAIARTLTIHDNGIGMNREEVIANIGTIARSGTQDLLQRLGQQEASVLPELIGRFGVGFYSGFMVADHVSLVTRRAGESTATRWESSGDGQFAISDDERLARGTSVTLRLRNVSKEAGIEDYTDHWVLSRIVKSHSDFVSYPIILAGSRLDHPPAGDNRHGIASAGQDKTLNSGKPVWEKTPTEVPEEEYRALYTLVADDWTEPLLRITAKAEGRSEFSALLFVPAQAPTDLYYHSVPFGLRLYAKRVLVLESCAELLPRYLRFVKGVVDALDLPLNISRQTLQESRHLTDIRSWVTRKVLDRLADLHTCDRDAYLKFWLQFGRALKEGIGEDFENRDRLLKLSLFGSSHHEKNLTTLAQYVERMKSDQKEIYYLTGESRGAVEHAPHLEAALAHGFEVLYFVDPVDELVAQTVSEYNGRHLKSLAKGKIDWEPVEQKDENEEPNDKYSALINLCEKTLGSYVKDVRLSTRLITSPACLTNEEYDYSPRMERLLLKGKGGGARQRRILELNPRHRLIEKLRDQVEANPADPRWTDHAELLFGYALLIESSELSSPVAFTRALVNLLERAL